MKAFIMFKIVLISLLISMCCGQQFLEDQVEFLQRGCDPNASGFNKNQLAACRATCSATLPVKHDQSLLMRCIADCDRFYNPNKC